METPLAANCTFRSHALVATVRPIGSKSDVGPGWAIELSGELHFAQETFCGKRQRTTHARREQKRRDRDQQLLAVSLFRHGPLGKQQERYGSSDCCNKLPLAGCGEHLVTEQRLCPQRLEWGIDGSKWNGGIRIRLGERVATREAKRDLCFLLNGHYKWQGREGGGGWKEGGGGARMEGRDRVVAVQSLSSFAGRLSLQ